MNYLIKKMGLLFCLGHMLFAFSCNEKPLNVPLIKSFSPSASPIEGIITIGGKNFGKNESENLVNANGSPCTILFASDTLLIVKADPGISSGLISVTVNSLSSVSHSNFTLIPHTIDSISSYTGAGGDKINFSGTHFCKSVNDVEVKFNTSVANLSNYRLQHDTTYFSMEVPAEATTGKIHVRIGAVTVHSKYDFEIK